MQGYLKSKRKSRYSYIHTYVRFVDSDPGQEITGSSRQEKTEANPREDNSDPDPT